MRRVAAFLTRNSGKGYALLRIIVGLLFACHRSFWPTANGGEMAVLYCFVFFYIFFHGSGFWSLDSLRRLRHESV
jgi:uncharacterized membrane protein YphA (DoxX/SURF4 family)